MSATSIFRFNQGTFDFGDGKSVQVDFVSDQNPKAKNTHFTLLMGANGTCKSRILSCCVNLLRGLHERDNAPTAKKGHRLVRSDEPDRDMRCDIAEVMRNGVSGTVGLGPLFQGSAGLPSRVLAVANLVRDRFTFVEWVDFDSPFYYYLGVRQASNLTTTGAMDRLVCDAVLNLLSEEDKYSSLSKWIQALFPRSELGLAFSRSSNSAFERFFEDPAKWVKRHTESIRYERRLAEIEPEIGNLKSLLRLVEEHGQEVIEVGSAGMKRGGTLTLCLDQLPQVVRQNLGKLRRTLSAAISARLLGRPSLVLKSGNWLDFGQLSSGEQNLLSTGARLHAFAAPGSLIVIDEPEVSLNIAWQQRYIDLISQALIHAQGSHVIIASHSPYLVSDLRAENSTVVVVQRGPDGLKFRSHPGEFWGWGSEAILYEVLGLPSASNYHFSRELAAVLKLVTEKSNDAEKFDRFLSKCDQMDFGDEAEPLKVVIEEIRNYAGGLKK